MRQRPGLIAFLASVLAAGLFAAPAPASQSFSDTNDTNVTLQVNRKGEALVTYTRSDGRVRHVLVWGAINALPPTDPSVHQVHFRFDYAGGWGKYRNGSYWRSFRNRCQPYDGPALVDLVAACKAPDGTYWALQSWQRSLPLLGFVPWLPGQAAYELHVSHWSGPLPQLAVGVHWTYGGTAVGLFGQLTYAGQPVHGFGADARGNPTDRYSRNVYIDTFNSVYGAGWARESGILVHTPNGTFCHSFVPQHPFPGYPDQTTRPAAPGDQYRVTVMGPGVTPVVQWIGPGLPTKSWDGTDDERQLQAQAELLWNQFMTGDARCQSEQSDPSLDPARVLGVEG